MNATDRNIGDILLFGCWQWIMVYYSNRSMNYELELETATNIQFKNFPHTREGLLAALSIIEKNKSTIIVATIVSSRDGIVFKL